MAHNLERSIDGFETAFASRQQPAWHGLGTVFEGDLTTPEMLKLAHLNDWDVRLEQVEVPEGYRTTSDEYRIIRTNPFDQGIDILGYAGERYQEVQNEELFAFGQEILHGGGRWETAGSIKDGKQIFASLAMPGSIVLDPKGRCDTVKNYLLLTSSHNGSIAVQGATTPVRTVCENTLNLALSNATQSFKIRHTTTVHGRIQAARDALSLNVEYIDAFEKEAQALIETEITNKQWFEIVQALNPKPENESKAARTRWENKIDLVNDIYRGQADGPNTQANIVGTAWGALNALTEQIDWYRKPRKGSAESVLAAASGFDPVTTTAKNKIRKVVLAAIA